MATKGYTAIPIPNELIKEIDAIIKKRKKGFRSKAELIVYAIRKLLEDL